MLKFSLLAILLCVPAAYAGKPISISLSQSASYTREHNPDLAAARLRIEEAKGRLLGSGRLSNPEVGFGMNSGKRAREWDTGISFDQRFPVTARLRLEKSLSQQLVRAAELEIRDMERLIISEAQTLIVRLLAVDQQRDLRNQQTALAKKLSSFATDRANKGEISPLDAAQAQVDSQRLLLEGRKLEAERVSLLGELKPKLGIAADSELAVTGGLPASTLPASAGWEGRPDYQLARTNEGAALTEIDLAKARKWQDISAGLVAQAERVEDAPDGFDRSGFIGFRVSIPLPFWNKNQGEIAEKNAAATRAALETKALAAGITNQIAAARAEMAANAKLADETKNKLLPLVNEQTEKLEKAYATGQADLLTILRAREQKLQLESAVLDATRDFHLARIRYETATAKHAPASPANSNK